jgi:hypothetical protein
LEFINSLKSDALDHSAKIARLLKVLCTEVDENIEINSYPKCLVGVGESGINALKKECS